MAATVQVTFDCADPGALSLFWNEVLGYRLDSPPPPYQTWDEALDAWNIPQERRNDASASVDPDGVGPRLWFQKVPEARPPRTASTWTCAPTATCTATSGWPRWRSGPRS